MKSETGNRLLLIMIAAFVLAGCATPAIYKPVVMAPKAKGMEKVNTVAITSVKGNSGRHYNGGANVVRAKLSSFLSSLSAPGKPGFKVVDNETLKNVIRQQQLSESAQFDSKTSIRLGKLLGADALVNASYQISNASDQSYQSEYTDRETCVEYKDDGQKCKKYKKRKEYCTKRNVTVELIPSVVDVTTGEIIFSKDYSSHLMSNKCPSKGDTLTSVDSMVTTGFDNVFSSMRKDFYYYEIVLTLKMIESDESGMPKSSKALLKTAMDLIENRMVDKACGQIAQAAAAFNQSPAIMYNMGICKEVKGENKFAEAFFERALDYSSLLSDGDKELVYRAIRRMEGTENLDTHNDNQSTFTDMLR